MGRAAPTLSKTDGGRSSGARVVEAVLLVDTPPWYQKHPCAGKSVNSLWSPKRERGIRRWRCLKLRFDHAVETEAQAKMSRTCPRFGAYVQFGTVPIIFACASVSPSF